MSDYDQTKRRIIGGKKIQYSSGGSRKQKSIKNDDMVTKVGVVTDAEIHAASSPFIAITNNPNVQKKLIEEGIYKLPPGTKFIDEYDENGRWQDNHGRWWSWDSEVMPGDVIEILDHEDFTVVGYRAMVKNVRSETAGRVSALMRDGVNENAKYVFERGQYKVVDRKIFKPISDDDYITKDMLRKDIVSEDLDD